MIVDRYRMIADDELRLGIIGRNNLADPFGPKRAVHHADTLHLDHQLVLGELGVLCFEPVDGGNPTDLPGVDQMSEAIDFFLAFAQSIFAKAVGSYLAAHYPAASPTCVELVQRQNDGPFRNGTVVVVEKPTRRLSVGQPVFVPIAPIGARWGRIQSLKVDDSEIQAVLPETAAPNGIGLGLDFRCPKGTSLVALEAEDDIVWSPPKPANAQEA